MSQRPAWHDWVNAQKPVSPLFNWSLNMRLQKRPKLLISLAARVDKALREDRSGWTGPALLAQLFVLLKRQDLADKATQLVYEIRTRPITPDSHLFPTKPYQVELCTLTDPETPTAPGGTTNANQ